MQRRMALRAVHWELRSVQLAALIFVIFIYMIYMTLFKKQMKRERNVSVDSLGYTMKVLIVTVIPVL